MNKRKIVLLATSLCMIAILAIGGTLAYFTDVDAQTNTFTIGNVKIDLFEDFDETQVLVPAVGQMDENGYAVYENKLEKEVYVENTGNQDAYVRVQIAIPGIRMEDGKVMFPIRLCWSEFTCRDGQWNWGKEDAANDLYAGLVNPGYASNAYSTTIDGQPYFVYVGTWETAMKKGDITLDAIDNVYMLPEVTQENIEYFNENAPDWNKVYVVAEAAQAEGFVDAFDALNTAFGVPGEYEVNFKAESKGQTIVERTGAEGN